MTESRTEVSPTPRPHGTFLSKENVPLSHESRPSDGWLRSPAWIDGGVNPPRFYHSHAEIEEVRNTYLHADDREFTVEQLLLDFAEEQGWVGIKNGCDK
ncbi:hypothetical protein BDR07DRAFT_1497566 [Suillus spraguei]|nr:hypothetical protein BDR07DRAFT_1497566 [Suillus spraguei]